MMQVYKFNLNVTMYTNIHKKSLTRSIFFYIQVYSSPFVATSPKGSAVRRRFNQLNPLKPGKRPSTCPQQHCFSSKKPTPFLICSLPILPHFPTFKHKKCIFLIFLISFACTVPNCPPSSPFAIETLNFHP